MNGPVESLQDLFKIVLHKLQIFFSNTLKTASKMYAAHNKELFVATDVLKIYTVYFHGQMLTLCAKQQSLNYFDSEPNLSQRTVRWL